MKFMKICLLTAALFGAQAQGMNPKKDLQKDFTKVVSSLDISEKVTKHWNNHKFWGDAAKIGFPMMAFFYGLEYEFLTKDKDKKESLKTKLINKGFFESENEYSWFKWGACAAAGALIFKEQIINAGVKRELFNKAAKTLGAAVVFGKGLSIVNNYCNKNYFFGINIDFLGIGIGNGIKMQNGKLSVVVEKLDETKDKLESQEKYGESLQQQVNKLKQLTQDIGHTLVLEDKEKTEELKGGDLQKADKHAANNVKLLKQVDLYKTLINDKLQSGLNISKMTSVKGSAIAFALLLAGKVIL